MPTHKKVKFEIGDMVTWTKKVGTIVAVVPAGEDVCKYAKKAVSSNMAKLGYGFGVKRGHDSYIVLVRTCKSLNTLKIYCPKVSKLVPYNR